MSTLRGFLKKSPKLFRIRGIFEIQSKEHINQDK